MSVEQTKMAFLRKIAPFNRMKAEIRKSLYNMKISETQEIKETVLKHVWLLFFSVKFRNLNHVEITKDTLKEILKTYREFFPQDDLKLNEYGLLRFLIGGI